MEAKTLLLKNARIVVPQRITEGASVLIEEERIADIFEKSGDAPKEVSNTYDLDGLTLYPGFIDIHIHGAVGVDTMQANADDLHRMAEFLARQGVTAWLPTLVPGPDEDYAKAARAVTELMNDETEREGPAARALGIHYEGPFVNPQQCGALRLPYFKTFKSVADIAPLVKANHREAVHLTTVAPEIEGGIELVKELVRQGWTVSIGHTRSTVDILDQAFEAGARHITHFMNAMAPLHHRAPGPIGWGLLRDEVMCDMIADGVHTDPLMLRLALKCKTSDRLALISDAVSPTGLGDGCYEIWGEKISVLNGKTQNERGSIAGSVITMLDAVRFMLRLGVSEVEVARMAALNPARTLKIDKTLGSIEIGKRADLVALDHEGKVRLTIIGGRVAHSVL
jgi:N-acetylglucosamine-6-phosphate deacetylase